MAEAQRKDRQLRSRRSIGGQALVEFTLVAPIFILLLFGIIEGGRFVFYYETLANATREGARFAIVNGSNSMVCPTGPAEPPGWSCDPTGTSVEAKVRNTAIGIPGPAITVERHWMDGDDADGDIDDGFNSRGYRVLVRAMYTYTSLVPLVPIPPITVNAESTLVINN